ncbi:SOS response-associated peptidase [Paenibacillus psychroresistens]|uniref:Abasic site processing protein n=1 Tax=Paenibacillus psychroresistens TaxID=1778678 RepID=A0A6B8RI63_9BACL|nr:SOS response-associated peptidase [Paenibacillus psychroresistens]QGQ96141.1 SOS response-associated peptidase [Paenibacillus psychroresistens]
MCGRYTIVITMDELMRYYMMEIPLDRYHTPRYNVAPGQLVMAVISDGEKNRLGELKWGLIPNWAPDEKMSYKMINARADTVAEKPAFRTSFQRKRCLIPADSFYEWKKIGTDKQPMRIMFKDEGIFSMAGLYDTWTAPDGNKISTCTIITTTPNELMADIHDRMPVILRREDEQIWLDKQQKTEDLQALLRPFPTEKMIAYPVSKIVGNVKNDRIECIEALPV